MKPLKRGGGLLRPSTFSTVLVPSSNKLKVTLKPVKQEPVICAVELLAVDEIEQEKEEESKEDDLEGSLIRFNEDKSYTCEYPDPFECIDG